MPYWKFYLCAWTPIFKVKKDNWTDAHPESRTSSHYDWYFLFVMTWPNIDMWPSSSFPTNKFSIDPPGVSLIEGNVEIH